MRTDQQAARARARFGAVAAGVAVAGAAGYAGFVAFAERDTALAVLPLGAATGFAAFFSPCSFPLLLTFLAREGEAGRRAALASALRVGAGAAFLLAAVGALVLAGGTALAGVVEFDSAPGRLFRGGIGAGLLVLGAYQFGLVRRRLGALDAVAAFADRLPAPSRMRHAATRDLAFGFGYLVAGFG